MYLRASWTARVGKMKWRLLRSSKSREQKKEAPSCPSTNTLSAIVCAMVLFPVPANPFSQYTGGLLKLLIQSSISFRTTPRVPFRQPLRSPCRYSAACAQRMLLRTTASAIGSLCQAPTIKTEDVLTWVLENKVILFARTQKGNEAHHWFVPFVSCHLVHQLLFMSTLRRVLWLETNLIIIDSHL